MCIRDRSLVNRHNSELADTLGNLVNRVLVLVEKNFDGAVPESGEKDKLSELAIETPEKVKASIEDYQFHNALNDIWHLISEANKYINENKGVILTGIIGIVLMSWELLKKLGWIESDVSVESLYSNWLIGYSSLLGPIAGIMIVDYFLIKKQSYDLLALYQDNAGYPAWNIAGMVALLIPVALTVLSFKIEMLSWFYTYGWFTGSILGGLIYYLVARGEIRSTT